MAKRKGPTPKKKPAPEAPSGGHGVAYAPPRRHRFDPSSPQVQEILQTLPKGIFSVVANESARYTAFMGNVLAMVLPFQSRFSIHQGCYVVDSCNRAFLGMNPDEDWIMIMGDDHQFPPEFALKLLALMYNHDLDVIAPLCFKRDFPPTPVVYRYEEAQEDVLAENYAWNEKEQKALFPINLNDFPEGGLIEVDGVGSAGMIVRRRVVEAMEPPWFRLGVGHWGEDLDFCRRAQELGFKIHVDLDMSLGHIVNTTIWPVRTQGGEWACEYDWASQGGFVLGL